jgi:hypothetical protein
MMKQTLLELVSGLSWASSAFGSFLATLFQSGEDTASYSRRYSVPQDKIHVDAEPSIAAFLLPAAQ